MYGYYSTRRISSSGSYRPLKCTAGTFYRQYLQTRRIHSVSKFIEATQLEQQLCRVETERCLARISENNVKINAFISVQPKNTLLQQADESDRRITDGQARPLEGVLVAAKDNFCTKDLPTTCASTMLKDFTSPFNATVVEKLQESGAIIVGKTNMDEFGMGSANLFSIFGPQYNSNNNEIRVAGGSSGGSAAAVAAGLCHAAIGSDTGGSVRLPAAYCGVVGFKPSYGQCSRYGLVSYASSLDTVGILAQSVNDARLLLDVMKGHDQRDASMMPQITFDSNKVVLSSGNLTGLVVGIPKEYYSAADHLQAHGAEINLYPAYYVIAPAEASSNLARYDGVRYGYRTTKSNLGTFESYAATRQIGFGDEVQRRILLGSFVLSESAYDDHFVRAQRIRRLIQQDFDQCFRTVHVLLTPCNITTAPTLQRATDDGVAAYVNDVMTVPASLAGIPAISIPWTNSPLDNYPIGMQLMAQYGQESTLLRVANVLEKH
ncbi:amidase signature domain-containing protein [Syncephalis fuscata]|nr:amidase signature domain-containing protein [Syncephalis fuscata]